MASVGIQVEAELEPYRLPLAILIGFVASTNGTQTMASVGILVEAELEPYRPSFLTKNQIPARAAHEDFALKRNPFSVRMSY